MPTQRRPSGHGLDDEAVTEGHDFIHRAEQDQRVGLKSGLPDSAIEAEHEFEDMVEGKKPEESSKPLGEKVKETLDKVLPDAVKQ